MQSHQPAVHSNTLRREEHPAEKCRSKGEGRHPWPDRLIFWRWPPLCDLLAAAVPLKVFASMPRGEETTPSEIILRGQGGGLGLWATTIEI